MKQLQILKDLIAIKSENPGAYEKEAAKYISRSLRRHAIPHTIVKASENRLNIVGELKGNRTRTLLFNGHTDTKPAGTGWRTNPFKPVIVEGRLYGLGACDMKGGIAAILAALIARSKEPHENGTIAFHFVADEEMNSKYGTRYLIDNGYLNGVSLAIIAEPSSMSLITKSVGNAWLKLSSLGQSAHAGTYWKGVSAIDAMHELLSLIKRRILDAREITGKSPENLFPNVNIGYISGGSHPGTVPSCCETLIDIRFFDETNRDAYLKIVSDSAMQISQQRNCIINTELFGGGGMPAWDITAHSSSDTGGILEVLDGAYESATKHELKKGAFYGGSDAGLISFHAGIPALILGPGNLEHAHTPNEWVDVEEVSEACSVYLEIMRRW